MAFCLAFDLLESRLGDDTGLPGDVYIVAVTRSSPDVLSLTIETSREESHIVVAMQTDVEHLVCVVEDVLSAIAVVDIPVEYQHFLAHVYRMLRCNRHIVEEAEALDF